MTISTTAAKKVLSANGATTVFGFDFYIPNAASLVVQTVDTAGNITTLTSGQYSVTGLGSSAGNVTISPAPASGITVVISRTVPQTQTSDFTNQDGFYPEVIESGLDLLTMMVQQNTDLLTRSIKSPVSESTPLVLPVASARANKMMAFDSSGLPIAYDFGADKAAAAASASSAASSATASSGSATASAASAAAANAYLSTLMVAYNNFIDQYLGAHSTPPTVDGQGLPVNAGDLYYDTVAPGMMVYTGSAWVAAYVQGNSFLPLAGGTLSGQINTRTVAVTQDTSSLMVVGRFSSGYGGSALNTQGGATFWSFQIESVEYARLDSGGVFNAYGVLAATKTGSDNSYVISNQNDPSTTNTFRPLLVLKKNGAVRFQISADGSAASAGTAYYETFGSGTHSHQFFTGGSLRVTFDSTGITAVGSISDSKGDVRKVIQNAVPATYTAVLADAGKSLVGTNASTNITIPASVFSAGDAITIVNYNTNSNFTITQGSGLSLVLASNSTLTTGNRTLASNGMCTLLFLNATTAYISGAGLT